ncbi:putative mitochondrial deoxynucleotide carrier protein [Blastocladiella britannica]|nr:putative mitochondrial deoxynucleotide carrier protein [Blastocladiella britannica]
MPSDAKTKTKQSGTANIACGAFAGLTTRVVISPIDVVKIRLQLQSQKTAIKYANSWDAARQILSAEGKFALWKGNLSAELLYLSYGAAQFWAYSAVSEALGKHQSTIGTTPQKYIAGAAAGTFATVLSYPFDLLRTRFATQGSGDARVYASIVSAVRTILAEEGVRGMYRGLGASIAQIIPYMAMTFGTYEWQRSLLRAARTRSPAIAEYVHESTDAVVAGASSGLLAKLTVYPFDTIRKRVQVQGPTRSHYVVTTPRYFDTRWWRVGAMLVHAEGVKGLYRGLAPSLVKAGVSSAVTFTAFEFAKDTIAAWNNNK